MAHRRSTRKINQLAALLDDAAARLEAGDGDSAITLLLQAWERARLPSLTRLIEALSDRLPVEPIEVSTDQQKRFLQWRARAGPRRAADVGPLLAEFTDALENDRARSYFVRGRLKVLRALPPDPRIGRLLLRLFDHPRMELSNDYLQGAKRHIDPYTNITGHLYVGELIEAQTRQRPKGLEAENLAPKLTRLEAAIETASLDPIAPLADEAPGLESDEAMLAAVYANPADDALRQIYADRLIELGEPHGEFITLQFQRAAGTLSPEGARREVSLLAKHHVTWLGALAPFVRKSSVTFEKGFVAHVSCTCKRVFEAKQTAQLTEWATVKDVVFDKISFITPTMKSLEIANNVNAFGVDTLIALDTLPPLKGLSLTVSSAQSKGEPRTCID